MIILRIDLAVFDEGASRETRPKVGVNETTEVVGSDPWSDTAKVDRGKRKSLTALDRPTLGLRHATVVDLAETN